MNRQNMYYDVRNITSLITLKNQAPEFNIFKNKSMFPVFSNVVSRLFSVFLQYEVYKTLCEPVYSLHICISSVCVVMIFKLKEEYPEVLIIVVLRVRVS